jgi:hypothetical protein
MSVVIGSDWGTSAISVFQERLSNGALEVERKAQDIAFHRAKESQRVGDETRV